MRAIEIIYGILSVLLGISVSVTDLKEGKIYNRTLMIYTIIALALGGIYYGCFARDLLIVFLLNIGVLGLINLILYYTHSFAGGDCKLALVMGLLYPANYYLCYAGNDISIYFVLGFAILYGYIYLVMSSVYKIFRGENKLSAEYVKNYVISFAKSFVSAIAYTSLVNLFLIYAVNNGITINIWVSRGLCIGIAWAVGKYSLLKKWYLIVCLFAVDFFFGWIIGVMPISTNLENYVLVVILLLCQMTIRTDLYEEVPIDGLRKGMILSMYSSLLMQNSRVRGLPVISTEDLKSRLTEEEVSSIKRWAEGKEINSVTVVKKIPFAVFIFAGFLSYFILYEVIQP